MRRPASTGLHALLAACGGFLVAVLWFDLMFDVQVRGHSGTAPLPDAVVASIAAYYRRVTTDAHPMQALVAAVMGVALVGTAWQMLYASHRPLRWAAVATSVVPIGLAAARVLPNAVRLGSQAGSPAELSALARSIFADHALCLASIVAFTGIQVVLGRVASPGRS